MIKVSIEIATFADRWPTELIATAEAVLSAGRGGRDRLGVPAFG